MDVEVSVNPRGSILCLWTIGCLVLVAGCGVSVRQAEPIFVGSVRPEQAFEASLAVLKGMHFAIDKVDPNIGAIRTKPLAGGQFFEFWRSDNTSIATQIEANLQTISRTAWVTVTPWSDGVRIDCLVRVQRLNLERTPIHTYSDAYRTTIRPALPTVRTEWVDLGQDTGLTCRILGRIQKRLAKQSGGHG